MPIGKSPTALVDRSRPFLFDLLGDLHPAVSIAAACALGRMARVEARPVLIRRLADDPTAEIIAALASVADEHSIIVMGRVVRTRPDLAKAVLEALDGCDHPQAAKVAQGISVLPMGA